MRQENHAVWDAGVFWPHWINLLLREPGGFAFWNQTLVLFCRLIRSSTEPTVRTMLLVLFCMISTSTLAAEMKAAPDIVFPQKLTAEELQMFCAASGMSSTGRQRQRYCEGFLSGIEEGVRVLGLISGTETTPALCMPADVSGRQMRIAFVRNSVSMDPAKDKPSALYAIEVLEKSYPCR